MSSYRSTGRSLWVALAPLLSIALTLVLLASAVFVYIVAAQGSPEQVVGPSGSTGDEGAVIPADREPVVALDRILGSNGGADVPLGGTREPAIAVNPLDRNNIAMADLFSLRVSVDAGANFAAPTAAPVPASHGQAGDPSVAFDSQGRLFWTYLGSRTDNGNLDVFISQVNPATGAILAGYPINVTAGAGLPAASGAPNCHDKEWLAADRFLGSSFQDRLYVVWTQFTGAGCAGPTVVNTTFSANQGLTWSPALALSGAGEGFVWPGHNAVAGNGDVYVAYHSQPTFATGAPNGTSGQIFVLRSTDGGVSYPQKNSAYAPGLADITFNVRTAGFARQLNQNISWTQGSAQPWVLPDPLNPSNVYVVAADDPTNTAHGGTNDDMAVYVVRSTNQGVNWSAPTQIDGGPGDTHQFFPTASIDDQTGCMAVTWYDTRRGSTNAANNFLLDTFLTASSDGGLTFGPTMQINDVAFDPDTDGTRFAGPPPTFRIGEYIGVAVANGVAHAVWTGNDAVSDQIMFDSALACVADLSITKTDDLDPAIAGDDLTYTLEVVNSGPSDATGVTVTDNLPPGSSFVSATPSQGSCTETAGIVACDLGILANGAEATVSIIVQINPDPVHVAGCPVTLMNSATAESLASTDPDLSDNIAVANTTVFLDDFNRPGGALGASWSGETGLHAYKIVNQQVDVEAGGVIYWNPTSFGADQEACVTLTEVDPRGYHHSLMLKVQDMDWRMGALSVYYRATTDRIGLESYVPGQGWTTLASFNEVLQDGDVLGARALADGTLQAYVNGVLIGEADAGSFFVDKGGHVGLWFIVAADAEFDDFSGGTIGALAAPDLPPLAAIVQPANGITAETGGLVVLQATAFDFEDGPLTGTQLSWHSDQNGYLGAGEELRLTTLLSGAHVITLTATDSDGNTAAATIHVFVRYKVLLPLIMRGP